MSVNNESALAISNRDVLALRPPWPKRASDWFFEHWADVSGAVSSPVLGMIAFIAGLASDRMGWLFKTVSGLAVLLLSLGLRAYAIVGTVFAIKKKEAKDLTLQDLSGKLARTASDLEVKNDHLERLRAAYRTLFESQLFILSMTMGFGDTERISVYRHTGRAFVMSARYSSHPVFVGNGRSVYPHSQGVIAAAWKTGAEFVDNLPDPVAEPKEYNKAQKARCNMPKCDSIRMQSRSYAAFSLYDLPHKKRVAVVVFESTKPDGLKREEITSLMSSSEERRISEFIDAFSIVAPELGSPQEEGF